MAVSVVKRTRRRAATPVITPITADIISIPREEETKEGENESADPQPPTDLLDPLDPPVVESIKSIIVEIPIVSTISAAVPPLIIDLTGDTTDEEEDEPPVVAYNDFISYASLSSPSVQMMSLLTTSEAPGYNFEEVWKQSLDSMLTIQGNDHTSNAPKPDEETVFHSTATRFASVLQGSFFVRPKKTYNGREIGDNHFEISSECNHQRGEFAATWEDGSLVMHPWNNNTYSQRVSINQFINNQVQSVIQPPIQPAAKPMVQSVIQPMTQPMTQPVADIWRPSVFTPTTVPTTPAARRQPPVFIPSTPMYVTPPPPTFASVINAPPPPITPMAHPVSVPIPPKPERITRPNPLLFRPNQGFPKRIVQ